MVYCMYNINKPFSCLFQLIPAHHNKYLENVTGKISQVPIQGKTIEYVLVLLLYICMRMYYILNNCLSYHVS